MGKRNFQGELEYDAKTYMRASRKLEVEDAVAASEAEEAGA
jgi:hypothetical protein